MGHYWHTGWFDFGWIWVVLFWALVVWLILTLMESSSDRRRSSHHHYYHGQDSQLANQTNRPLDILKERYAKGEITKEQFDQMKKDLE